MLNDIETLNLNLYRLTCNRKAVIDALTDILGKKQGTRTISELTGLLIKWESKDSNNQLKPYCGVAIYYLNKRIRRISRR